MDTFRLGAHEEQARIVQASLWTKSWLIHLVVTFSRILYPLMGTAYWQKAYAARADLDTIDLAFVERVMGPTIIAIYCYVAAGVLLDLLVWRRRKYASWIIYYECVVTIISAFVPFDYGSYQGIILLMVLTQTFIEFATATGPNILALALTCLVIDLGIVPKVYA